MKQPLFFISTILVDNLFVKSFKIRADKTVLQSYKNINQQRNNRKLPGKLALKLFVRNLRALGIIKVSCHNLLSRVIFFVYTYTEYFIDGS